MTKQRVSQNTFKLIVLVVGLLIFIIFRSWFLENPNRIGILFFLCFLVLIIIVVSTSIHGIFGLASSGIVFFRSSLEVAGRRDFRAGRYLAGRRFHF